MEDESTPLESAYLVPLEFGRLKKDNLTFWVFPKCNHSLIEWKSDGSEVMHMETMLAEFFSWVEKRSK